MAMGSGFFVATPRTGRARLRPSLHRRAGGPESTLGNWATVSARDATASWSGRALFAQPRERHAGPPRGPSLRTEVLGNVILVGLVVAQRGFRARNGMVAHPS